MRSPHRCCRYFRARRHSGVSVAKTSSFSNTLADNDQIVQQLIDNLNTVVGTIAKDGDKVLRRDRPPRAACHRAVGRPRSDRRRDRLPHQRDRLAGRSVDQRAAAAVRHRGSAESAGAAARSRQGSHRRRNREGAAELPQAGPTRRNGATIPYYLCSLSFAAPIFRARRWQLHGSGQMPEGARNPNA